MLLHRSPPLLFVALLCASVLFVRGGGMHLHLCLDGKESPTEIHWADAGVHNDVEHASEPHNDRDVALGEVAGKLSKTFGDLQFAVVAALSLLFLLPRVSERVTPRPAARPSAARFYRPPLRGPPL